MEKLIEFLSEGEVTVDFTKVDGAPRTMNCTTSEEIIPVQNIVKESSKKKNDEVAVVWDLDKSAWRLLDLTALMLSNIMIIRGVKRQNFLREGQCNGKRERSRFPR